MNAMRVGGIAILFSLVAGDVSTQEYVDKAITRAIERGVAHLKKLAKEDGLDSSSYPPGLTALAGWTLLETGASPGAPLVRDMAKKLREASLTMRHTYPLTLTLIFFDRLGDAGDESVIESLALRLIAGQNEFGGWWYDCPPIGVIEAGRLKEQLVLADKARKTKGVTRMKKKRHPSEVTPEIRRQIDELYAAPREQGLGLPGDNSNTQFAMMALWVARRHGLRVEPALEKVDRRFRLSQHEAGGWSYSFTPAKPRLVTLDLVPPRAMTCAGLLGLALGHGIRPKAAGQDIRKDARVKQGMQVLEKHLNDPQLRDDNVFYFLFSLERMAVVYDLQTIGGKDWYAWGSRLLVESQQEDGSWAGGHQAADTCFALLFLKRANVAEDLTLDLKGIVREGPPATKIKKTPGKSQPEPPLDLPRIGTKDDKKPKKNK